MTKKERERFDTLLEEAMEALPPRLHDLIQEVPLIVDDRPSDDLAKSLAKEFGEEDWKELADTLCGLHTGVALTERSVEQSADVPDHIQIFRVGIIETAGGWHPQKGETPADVDDAVYEEIMVTLLHEIGHHFGLDEDDLTELGYD